MKQSRVLETEVEADVPYGETRLARRAASARPRLAAILLVGAAGFALEAATGRDVLMGALALAVALAAAGVWRKRLGGAVAAALAATLALLVPLALLAIDPRGLNETVLMAFIVAWGAIMLPDVVILLRDAELQHAYGLWARRG